MMVGGPESRAEEREPSCVKSRNPKQQKIPLLPVVVV